MGEIIDPIVNLNDDNNRTLRKIRAEFLRISNVLFVVQNFHHLPQYFYFRRSDVNVIFNCDGRTYKVDRFRNPPLRKIFVYIFICSSISNTSVNAGSFEGIFMAKCGR